MQAWSRFNSRRWYWRWPIKALILIAVTFAVCFPYPRLTWRHFEHAANPNRMIDADAPGLQPLVRAFRSEADPNWTARQTLDAVERFVDAKVPYAFDWDTWGLVDYLPTVEETLDRGREDCDGRAVVAASLLRQLGFQSRLVANTAHVWVWTPEGETMKPQKSRIFEARDDGVHYDWSGLTIVPRSMGFGIAVFPFVREFVVVWVLSILLAPPRVTAGQALGVTFLLLVGLLCLRLGGASWRSPRLWLQLLGVASCAAAIIMPIRWRTNAARAGDLERP